MRGGRFALYLLMLTIGVTLAATGPIHARGTDTVVDDNNDVFTFPAGTLAGHERSGRVPGIPARSGAVAGGGAVRPGAKRRERESMSGGAAAGHDVPSQTHSPFAQRWPPAHAAAAPHAQVPSPAQ